MIFKLIGFLLGLLTLITVLGSVLTGTVRQNLVLVIALLGINLVVTLALPAAFPKNAVASQIVDGLQSFGKATNKILVSVLLFLVYMLAVGSAWAVSRILQKRFLQLGTPSSTWVAVKGKKIDFEEMF